MKKLIALLLTLVMALSLVACGGTAGEDDATGEGNTTVNVMTYEEFMAAEADTEVTIETYVQASESWWDGMIALYCQGPDGAYYLYKMACTEEEAAKLVPGTKVRATGPKTVWNGEVEIMEGTVSVVEGADTYIAEATEVNASDDLTAQMNKLVSFKGLTVAASTNADGEEVAYLYNWDGSGEQGNDLYFKLTDGTTTITFTVNTYMLGTGADSDVYTTIQGLQIGDTVNVEGFLYWYEGAQPHVTAIEKAA